MHGLEMMMRVGPEFFEAFFVYKFKIKRLKKLKHHNENLKSSVLRPVRKGGVGGGIGSVFLKKGGSHEDSAK